MNAKTKQARKRAAKKPTTQKIRPVHFSAPDYFPGRAVEIWSEIVGTLPSQHFYESDLPILREYVMAIYTIERLREKWDGEPTMEKRNQEIVVNPTLNAILRCQNTAAALAGKLRVCPSARLSKEKAGFEKPKPRGGISALIK